MFYKSMGKLLVSTKFKVSSFLSSISLLLRVVFSGPGHGSLLVMLSASCRINTIYVYF